MKWSIRLKFLLVMSGLLLTCMGTYLLMAITVFKSDKTQLVFDLNRSQVANLASELEAGLTGVSEKLKLFAQLPVELRDKMVTDLFSEDSDLVAITLFKANGTKPTATYSQKEYLETYGLQEKTFENQLVASRIPMDKILRDGQDIWNASSEDSPPLLAFGRLVLHLDEDGIPVDQWVVIGYVKIDRLLKSVSIVSLSEILVSNYRGEVLVQRDAKALAKKPSIKASPFFQKAKELQTKLSITKLTVNEDIWLAAFAKAFDEKIVIIAKAPEKQAFMAVRQLATRTILFGSIVLTLVILAALLLSRSLTRNIALLAERMTRVSEGDLTTTLNLRGRDETVSLADSFNEMISDLKKSRDELEIMNRDLDKKVKERTRELEQQKLKVVEAQEALLKTTRLASMGEIAGRAAHEVLNPLTSLLTRANLVQRKVADKHNEPVHLLKEIGEAWSDDYQSGGFDNLVKVWNEPSKINDNQTLFEEDLDNISAIQNTITEQNQDLVKDLSFIRQEGDRIGKIIHGMRRLGNMNSNAEEHSLQTILQDCCDIMDDLFAQKRFNIEKEFSQDSALITVDRDELIQAITNLMRNSLQAMDTMAKDESYPHDKFRLSIKAYLQEGQWWVDITDNGIGIDNQYHDHLFETRFTTKSSDEGTGLGLNISRRFVRSYGGDIIFVKSDPGVETTFRIKLPVVEESNTQRKASA